MIWQMNGTEQQIISEAMRLLGRRTSDAKKAAVRENGKRGGRPVKNKSLQNPQQN